jgi:hypothetical protein
LVAEEICPEIDLLISGPIVYFFQNMWTVDEVLELVIPITSVLLMLMYHTYLFFIAITFPKRVNFGHQTIIRKKWVKWVLFTPGAEILGVQAMRNAMMAYSFIASLCSALAFYFVRLASTQNVFILEIQNFSLSLIFFVAFLLFAFGIRYLMNNSYLVSATDMTQVNDAISRFLLTPESRHKEANTEAKVDISEQYGGLDPLRVKNLPTVERNMFMSTMCFTFGVRFMLFGVPTTLWIGFGAWAMLGSSIGVIILLFIYDHF